MTERERAELERLVAEITDLIDEGYPDLSEGTIETLCYAVYREARAIVARRGLTQGASA